MNLNFIWEALIILPVAVTLLRLAGKKTIAEMSSLEVITTLSIGTIISHAITEEGIWKTVTAMVIIVTFLIVAQFIQLKIPWFEKMFIGSATIVIKDGRLMEDQLKKLRMTSKQLEMRLRQHGIKSVSLLKTATIEANGQLGFELYPEAEPITYGDFMKFAKQFLGKDVNHAFPAQKDQQEEIGNLFTKL